MALVIRLEFGPGDERPLKARHKHVRQAVAASGNRSVTELLNDPFGGWPYLLQALVNSKSAQPISLDKASELIDAYSDQHDGIIGLGEALGKLLGDYVNREATPTDKETEDAEATGTIPNAATRVAPGHIDD